MGVHIRLQRRGNTHRPFYHLVAADQRAKRDGKSLEKLGYYDPKLKPMCVKINEKQKDRIIYWYKNGALLTDAAKKLIKKAQLVSNKKLDTAKENLKDGEQRIYTTLLELRKKPHKKKKKNSRKPATIKT